MQTGELSKRSGSSRDTIRFYEKMGLIRMSDRERNRYQYKDYSDTILQRLPAIRTIKRYGFALQETLGMLLLLFDEGVPEPERARRYVERKVRRIHEQIGEMAAVKEKLQEILDEGEYENCPIGQVLRGLHPGSEGNQHSAFHAGS